MKVSANFESGMELLSFVYTMLDMEKYKKTFEFISAPSKLKNMSDYAAPLRART